MKSKIVFIGAGNMAEAIVSGMIAAKSCPPEKIVMTDILPERLAALEKKYGVATSTDNSVAGDAEIILLAVKPQMMTDVLRGLSVKKETLILSIAAGITTEKIEILLGGDRRVVRIMPNTPALIGQGASAIAGGKNAGEADLITAEQIFNCVGISVRVQENEIDAVTALSGSGPAYVFYLIESMLAAGETMGLENETAKALALQTVEGAAQLMKQSGEDAGALRAKVTSKGGTTDAAINSMETAGVKNAIINALLAAEKRSKELSAS